MTSWVFEGSGNNDNSADQTSPGEEERKGDRRGSEMMMGGEIGKVVEDCGGFW
jgi:hypothetical protein